MLIHGADVHGHGLADLRIEQGLIAAIGALSPRPGEQVIEARGAAMLPGLHDHHIHLAGLAVRDASVWCGPQQVCDEAALAAALGRPGSGWIRGIGYHESVMGLPDARALDRLVLDRPLRIQHRSGRMWLFNSAGLDAVLASASPPPGLEREAGKFTGRLFDEDPWLRRALASAPPSFANVSARLASFGVTGLTDMTPHNDAAMAAHFAAEVRAGSLLQRATLAGTLELADAVPDGWQIGPAKLHLHEAALPDFDGTTGFITAAHRQGRGVAVHCTTEVELVFTIALFEAAGSQRGDRIEHAGIAAPEHIARMAELGLAVCVQPQFIAERGDRYRVDVEAEHLPHLYRLASFRDAGLAMLGGSDAPFADADPWAAMRAAVSRQTQAGHVIGADEALSPEEALALHLGGAIAVGASADLCLLSLPWQAARSRLDSADVRLVLAAGRIIHQRIDEPPFERLSRGDPAA